LKDKGYLAMGGQIIDATIVFGINKETLHAAYIAHWIELLKHDDRAFFTAANKAQKGRGLPPWFGASGTPVGGVGMSAFIVSHKHIDTLASAMLDTHMSYWDGHNRVYVTRDNAEEVGRILLEENVRSVLYRYGGRVAAHQLCRGGVLRDLGAKRANLFHHLAPPQHGLALGEPQIQRLRRNTASAPRRC
jgi:zincin-like metallopeptidase